MTRLELRIPPDVVWVAVAVLMWLVSTVTPRVVVPSSLRIAVVISLSVAGVALMAGARAALSHAGTTWHPMTPTRTSSLVDSGVYSLSRNPIYLGMLLVMFGLGVALASPAALLTSALFVLYLNRFQIAPEERALASALGQEFEAYRSRVRRWL